MTSTPGRPTPQFYLIVNGSLFCSQTQSHCHQTRFPQISIFVRLASTPVSLGSKSSSGAAFQTFLKQKRKSCRADHALPGLDDIRVRLGFAPLDNDQLTNRGRRTWRFEAMVLICGAHTGSMCIHESSGALSKTPCRRHLGRSWQSAFRAA